MDPLPLERGRGSMKGALSVEVEQGRIDLVPGKWTPCLSRPGLHVTTGTVDLAWPLNSPHPL